MYEGVFLSYWKLLELQEKNVFIFVRASWYKTKLVLPLSKMAIPAVFLTKLSTMSKYKYITTEKVGEKQNVSLVRFS